MCSAPGPVPDAERPSGSFGPAASEEWAQASRHAIALVAQRKRGPRRCLPNGWPPVPNLFCSPGAISHPAARSPGTDLGTATRLLRNPGSGTHGVGARHSPRLPRAAAPASPGHAQEDARRRCLRRGGPPTVARDHAGVRRFVGPREAGGLRPATHRNRLQHTGQGPLSSHDGGPGTGAAAATPALRAHAVDTLARPNKPKET